MNCVIKFKLTSTHDNKYLDLPCLAYGRRVSFGLGGGEGETL